MSTASGCSPTPSTSALPAPARQSPAAEAGGLHFGRERHVHHRGASMPLTRDNPARIDCDVLVDAVVGGPD
jgi:hypothetical protein